jgi:hypothetical protein
MAARKKTTKVTVEIDFEVLEKLAEAAAALSEVATAVIIASSDPKVKALKKKATPKKKSRR